MKIEDFNTFIQDYIKDRFQLEPANDTSRLLCSLEEKNLKKNIFRIQRINKDGGVITNWKTLLIVEIQSKQDQIGALEWAAIVKDTLLDPETADLYLFIIFEKDKIDFAIEECYSLESTEQYCRKYVQKADNTPLELLERTFLSKLEDANHEIDAVDPFNTVIGLTADKHPWLTADEQKKWKAALLSDSNGSELLEMLIPEIKD